MFEEFINPLESFTFKGRPLLQIWESEDNQFFIRYDTYNKKWKVIFLGISEDLFFETKQQATNYAFMIYQEKFGKHAFENLNKTLFQAGNSLHRLYCNQKATQVLMRKQSITGRKQTWAFDSEIKGFLAASVLPFSVQQASFKTRQQLTIYLIQTLTTFLPDIVQHSSYCDYETYKANFWWHDFIKDTVDIQNLTNMFSS